MRILHLADLHLHWFDWIIEHGQEYDLVALAGDLQDGFSDVPIAEQTARCSEFLCRMTAPTVVVSGNHDYWESYGKHNGTEEGLWLKSLAGKGSIAAVDGDTFSAHGLTLAASGWLSKPRLGGRLDILISHAPPAGSLCAMSGEDDFGDVEIRAVLDHNQPWLMLCGHVHEPTRYWDRYGPTLILNPGYVESAPEPNHWVIDTSLQTARHSSGTVLPFPTGCKSGPKSIQ